MCALAVCLLSVMTAAALSPSGSKQYQGIDVSEWQGSIDFAKVKDAGIQMVYIRASVGDDYVDPYFRRNYDNAKKQGLLVGFYHYVTATSEAQAERQARFFASTVSGTRPDCRLAMDYEYFSGQGSATVNRIAKAFMRELERASGKELVVYSNTNSARTVFDRELAERYPLWVAQWGVSEPGENGKWDSWVGWQYTDAGRVSGISGNVDRDRFTEDILLSDSGEIPKPEPEPEPEPKPDPDEKYITYTVRRGDTLWDISRRYDTTVARIVELNHIKNPDLIYAGQKFKIEVGSASGQTGGTGTADGYLTYTVRRGDTLWDISRRYDTTVSELVRLNHIKNPDLIYAGQVLKIKKTASDGCSDCVTYTVRRGDTLWDIARRHGTTACHIAGVNHLRNPDLIYAGQKLKIPV